MLASIIVPSYGNRLDYLKDTLISVQNQEFSDNDYEIIVVDNSPHLKLSTITDDINQNGGHHVRYIQETRMGLIHARHTGAHQAKGEILVYIDDDILAPKNWLKNLIEQFKDPDIGCCGGKILPKWEAKIPSWYSQFRSGYLSLLDLGDETKELKKPRIWGCNMALRKYLLFALGGFHPDGIGDRRLIWLRGNGECGLEQKILDIGFKLKYEPRAWLYHRIPEKRLKPEYYYWRLFTQGIDDSYVYLRSMRANRTKYYYLRIFKEIILSFVRSCKALIQSYINKDKSIKLKADSYYWQGKCQHLIRTLLSKKLKQHVFRNSYL